MSDTIKGVSVLTMIVGIILCCLGITYGGAAGLLSAVIFTIGFYQWLVCMAAGGPGVGMIALLVIAFEVFILFCVSALLFGQDVTLQAASYWAKPIAWGGAPIDNLWAGIMDGDSGRKWLGVMQLSVGAGIILGIWGLIHALGRR